MVRMTSSWHITEKIDKNPFYIGDMILMDLGHVTGTRRSFLMLLQLCHWVALTHCILEANLWNYFV